MDLVQYSLPQRQEHIRQLRESKTCLYEYQLLFQGEVRRLPVFSVDIGFPCYRLANGRTRDAQLEVIATEKLAEDFFAADPDSEPALARQHEVLRNMVAEAGLLRTFKRVKQDQPLILTNDGYVVNGNRRLCAMRLLLGDDEIAYAHFKHVQVVFLPPCSERDIKELEGRLQVQPELRAEYSWTAEAMLYRDLRQQKWTDEEIAELYQKSVAYIRELIAMLDDAEYYIENRGIPGKYSQLVKKEYAFRQLQRSRRKCGNDEPRKQFLTSIAYLMLDDPDTGEGRLYDSIPDGHQFLDEIAVSLARDFAGEVPKTEGAADDLEILGGASGDSFIGIVQLLGNEVHAPKAREVIRDTIQEMRTQERERKDATYCFRQVQQAYTRLQSALSSLDESADTTGIDDALKNIDQTVSSIRDWLSNANDQN